ncbi:diguanylate cyclase [Oleidesulfovibrio sp.]|uniref:diguanylate cyclase n=1 Tax=Oleidesulfovibrio sp. TaxID=2909707 RepID=UPI003A8B2988
MRKYFFPLAMAILSFSAFIVAMVSIEFTTASEYAEQFNKQQVLQVRVVTNAIEDQLSLISTSTHTLAEYSRLALRSGDNKQAAVLSTYVAEHPSILAYAIMQSPTKVDSVDMSSLPEAEEAALIARKWISENWAQASQSLSDDRLIAPLHITAKHQFAGLLYPFPQNGQLRTMSATVVNLTGMARRYLADLQKGNNGSGFILTDEGTILFAPDAKYIGKNVFNDVQQISNELMHVFREVLAARSGSGVFDFSKNDTSMPAEILLAWNTVDFGGRQLKITLAAPGSAVTEAIQQQNRWRFTVSVLLMVGIVLAVALIIYRRGLERSRENEERFSHALTGNKDAIWDWDIPENTVFYSSRWQQMLERGNTPVYGHPEEWARIVPTKDYARVHKAIQNHLDGMTDEFESEHRMLTAKGNIIWVLERGAVIKRDHQGKPLRMVGTTTDITPRMQTQAERDMLFKNSIDMLATTDFDGKLLEANPAWHNTLGWETRELILPPRLNMIHPEDAELTVDAFNDIFQGIPVVALENRFKTKDGNWLWLSWNILPDMQGRHIFITARDVSKRKEYEHKLRTQAFTDALTGLFNRRHLFAVGSSEIARARRFSRPLSCVMLDIDHFKSINDTFGHAAGDKVLQVISSTMQQAVRPSDTLGRIGGEEFIILMPETQAEQAVHAAERLRATIEAEPIEIGPGQPMQTVTVSIGVAELDHQSGTMDSLTRAADQALYIAKEKGRNRVELKK